MILRKLLFLSIFCFFGNIYSQGTIRVVFAQYENGKINSYDTLWFTNHAKKTRFYYYDLDQMLRYKIWGNDTLITSQKEVQANLKKQYSDFNVQLLKSKPESILGLNLNMARVKAIGVDPKNSRTFMVHYAPTKIHKNFYFDDIFKEIPGLAVYWSVDDKNYTQAIEIKEVGKEEMNIPKFKAMKKF